MLIRMAIALLAAKAAAGSGGDEPQCRNHLGTEVDWWLALKLPNSFTFAVIDPASSEWQFGGEMTHHEEFAGGQASLSASRDPHAGAADPLLHTLAPLYRVRRAQGEPVSVEQQHVLYNDEFPHGTEHWNKAHSKGALLLGASGGLWLQHSTPHFPLPPKATNHTYVGLPPTAHRYGQHFLCVSLGADALGGVARALLSAGPHIYSWHLDQAATATYPDVRRLALHDKGGEAPANASATEAITTRGGERLLLAGKAPGDVRDLYAGLLLRTLGGSPRLAVETWRHGTRLLPSACSSDGGSLCAPEVLNVQGVALPASAGGGGWSTLEDHAKWAVALGTAPPPHRSLQDSSPASGPGEEGSSGAAAASLVACTADMNRAISQESRGGTAVCFVACPQVWRAMRLLVAGLECCPGCPCAVSDVALPAAVVAAV